MPKASSDFIERLFERLDRLDPASVHGYLLKLVRERGLLETIFQSVHEGIIIIDRDLRVEFANRAAVELLGLPAEDRDHEPIRINRVLRELDWTRLLAQAPEEWERASRRELEVFYPRHRFLEFYLLPYRNQADARDHSGIATIILHDVTAAREQTETTVAAERLNAITMLAAGVAHEIGNPLNSLSIQLQLLERYFRRQPPDDHAATAQQQLQTAINEVHRLDNIITRFLKAVRPAALDLQPVLLQDVIGETLRLMRVEVENRRVRVECGWSADVPRVQGDAEQLQQAFYNIISNALQAMPEGGGLKITLAVERDQVVLKFVDSGKGIPPDLLGRIFEPYFTTRASGTGLGLMVVERIIRDHGATLGVESQVGVGTVFTINFPVPGSHKRLLEQARERQSLAPGVSTERLKMPPATEGDSA